MTAGAHLELFGALKDKSALKMRQGVALGLTSSGMVRNGENSSLGSSPTGSCSSGGVSGRLNFKFYGSFSAFPAQVWNFGWWHPTEPALGIKGSSQGLELHVLQGMRSSRAWLRWRRAPAPPGACTAPAMPTAPNPARNLQSSFQAVPAILHQI